MIGSGVDGVADDGSLTGRNVDAVLGKGVALNQNVGFVSQA
jgi:hypothetical protein